MLASKPKTLLLFAQYTDFLSYYDDWKDAFVSARELDADSVNICDKVNILPLRKTIMNYDLIVLLHSTNADTLDFIKPYTGVLNQRKGKLVVFVGNEYNSPAPGGGLADKIAFLQNVNADIVATQLPVDIGQKLYDDIPDARVVSLPHALNPKRFYPRVAIVQRNIDIGLRAGRYYPLIGDNERASLIDFFLDKDFDPPIKVDIEIDGNKRFNKDEWPVFLSSCKGTIGTEAGSYFLEKNDSTVKRISEYVKSTCSITQKYYMNINVRKYSRFVPDFVKLYLERLLRHLRIESSDPNEIYFSVDFDEIHELFYKNYRAPLNGKCISSRHFDAIGTKTCQIMFPGKFNGILESDVHYLSLNRDFSNIKEVLEKFRDDSFRCRLVDEVYDYVMDSHTYTQRMHSFMKCVS